MLTRPSLHTKLKHTSQHDDIMPGIEELIGKIGTEITERQRTDKFEEYFDTRLKNVYGGFTGEIERCESVQKDLMMHVLVYFYLYFIFILYLEIE